MNQSFILCLMCNYNKLRHVSNKRMLVRKEGTLVIDVIAYYRRLGISILTDPLYYLSLFTWIPKKKNNPIHVYSSKFPFKSNFALFFSFTSCYTWMKLCQLLTISFTFVVIGSLELLISSRALCQIMALLISMHCFQ